MELQFKDTTLESEYIPMQPTYATTIPGTNGIVTPLAKSTPLTQSSQIPKISAALPHVRDILEPASNDQA